MCSGNCPYARGEYQGLAEASSIRSPWRTSSTAKLLWNRETPATSSRIISTTSPPLTATFPVTVHQLRGRADSSRCSISLRWVKNGAMAATTFSWRRASKKVKAWSSRHPCRSQSTVISTRTSSECWLRTWALIATTCTTLQPTLTQLGPQLIPCSEKPLSKHLKSSPNRNLAI